MKTFRLLLFLVMSVLGISLCAYSRTSFACIDTIPTEQLHYIGLFTRNVNVLKTWYEEKLGFKVLEYNISENGFGFAMLEGYGMWIEMIQNPNVVERAQFNSKFPNTMGTHGFFKLGFEVQNIEALFQEMKSKGLKFKYELMTNPRFKMRLFILEDLEGNGLQFFGFY